MSSHQRSQCVLTPEEFVEGYQYIIEYMSDGVPLKDVLIKALKYFEQVFEDTQCTIMLSNEYEKVFTGGVTHSLPMEMIQPFLDIELYDGMGTCGTALIRKETVITQDINKDRKWDSYRHMIKPYGLKSCWSVPIFDPEAEQVIAVFAMYSYKSKTPTEKELDTVNAYKELIGLIISNYMKVKQSRVELGDAYRDPFDKSQLPMSMSAREKYKFMIRRGLEERQLRPNYQPIITHDMEIYGFEVLIRWPHPEEGMIPPNKFIPFAEQEGFIDEIDRYVCEYACREVKQLMEDKNCSFVLTINVSARHITKSNFIANLKTILDKTNFPPHLLALEITETSLMINLKDAANVIEEIRSLNAQVWVDDFGTTYSSLNYLRHLPIDVIKLDGSFIKEINKVSVDQRICQTIINLATELNLKVVAEGVETEEQCGVLAQFGCQFFQGYYFEKPMNLDDFHEYIEKVRISS
ncbi:sensor domain-containing phosphodiesterase [Alkalibacillus aidingensis]|uniref:sensor domain-containing phosphodiesterase n=1 Tax=Alkalibacillus aidingensis TaxID=2747607 RepID=UPI0016601A55|nr:EAL domain-containing protein [Alkalibacillus aidingensis]